jgi:adenylate cyclase
MKIVIALQIKLTEGEQARISPQQFKNINSFNKVLQAKSLWNELSKKSMIRLGQLAQEIVDAEPESSVGYRYLGWSHYSLARRGISYRENVKKAFKFAQKAISIDEHDGFSHSLLGYAYLLMKEHEKAIASGKRAVELQPNGAEAHFTWEYVRLRRAL